MNPIPDLFVIGAMKSGTTTFYDHYFNGRAFNLTKDKEHNGFVRYVDLVQITESYQNQYKGTAGIKCDISPKYSQRHLFLDTAKKIYTINPLAKIVYVIRDPVERTISHVHHDILRDRINSQKFESVITGDSTFIMTSKYFYQISSYLKYFPIESILVVKLEDIIENRERESERIGDFLGINDFTYSSGKSFVSEKRYKIYCHDQVHRMFGESLITRLYHLFWFAIGIRPLRPKISESLCRKLKSYFANDVENLVKTFSLNINNWPNFGKHNGEKAT